MVLEGYISKIIYSSEDTAYAVFVVEQPDGDEVAVGDVPGIAEGMYIQAEGEYVHHPQYDLQFKISSCELTMPTDIEGIVRFLGSGIIKGIGEVLAKRIVKKFGEDTLQIIEKEPERLAEVSGISERIANKIAVSYLENKSYRGVIMYLGKYGIGVNLAMKIYAEFGEEIYEVVRRNPYEIADRVPRVGFKTVDRLALNAGLPEDSEDRIFAAVLYEMNQIMSYGHIFLPEAQLKRNVFGLINSDLSYEEFEERLDSILFKMESDGSIIVKELDNLEENAKSSRIVYTKWNYFMELDSARRLLELRLDYDVKESEVKAAINKVEKELELSLAEEQREAVYNAVCSGVSVITGGPGTGKTTIINAIIKYYEDRADKIELAAPTGRAAKRITESTGYKAQTIHRLLEFSGELTEDGAKRSAGFQRNASNPLDADVVIIDEASMLDSALFYSLLKALTKGMRLVLVGDTDQLPSVGAGNVLHDIIDSECFPVTTLDKNFRQSDDSRIIENAHKIKKGEHLEINNDSKDFFFIPHKTNREIADECALLVNHDLSQYLNVSPLDIEVLTPTRQYDLGVEALNKKLQATINPPGFGKREKERGDVIFREGDKVMQIRNNYKLEWRIYGGKKKDTLLDEGVGVFNGDMGIITKVNDFDEEIEVTFDDGRLVAYAYNQLDELEHSFAITIHKSQGSEYPAVVIPAFKATDKLLTRNLIYTAVTRAKQLVVIVGNLGIINRMIDNTYEQRRYTTFKARIMEMASESESQEYMSLFDEDIEWDGLRDE
ncbi:exodeoxyribonuclease V alpha subunit [Lachnospiraceae bacterium NE2001]|nr:exodeoxyribonuclease V alpha subunit [Lachnospiraceae bacterium NE2001]